MEKSLQTLRKLHLTVILASVTIILFSATKDWNHIDNIKKAIRELSLLNSYTEENFRENSLTSVFTSKNEYQNLLNTTLEHFNKFKSEYKLELKKKFEKNIAELRKLGITPITSIEELKKLNSKLRSLASEKSLLEKVSPSTSLSKNKLKKIDFEIETVKSKIKSVRLYRQTEEIRKYLTGFDRISASYSFVMKNIDRDADSLGDIKTKLDTFNKVISTDYIKKLWPYIREVFKNNVMLLKHSDYFQVIPGEGVAFYLKKDKSERFDFSKLLKSNSFNKNHVIKKTQGYYQIDSNMYLEIVFYLKEIVKTESKDISIFSSLFPYLSSSKILREIKQNKFDNAEQSLYKFLTDEQDKDTLELVGIKVSAKNIAIIGPTILLVLLYYMLAVMIHIFRIKDKVEDFQIINTYLWMGLFDSIIAWLLTPITLILFSLAGVILILKASKSVNNWYQYFILSGLILFASIKITYLSYKLRKLKTHH